MDAMVAESVMKPEGRREEEGRGWEGTMAACGWLVLCCVIGYRRALGAKVPANLKHHSDALMLLARIRACCWQAASTTRFYHSTSTMGNRDYAVCDAFEQLRCGG
jgi:hypothetical protein